MAQSPLPSKIAAPRAASPIFTPSVVASKSDRMYAMIARASSVCSISKLGIPAAGLPVASTRARSSSDLTVRNLPARKSTPLIWSPFTP